MLINIALATFGLALSFVTSAPTNTTIKPPDRYYLGALIPKGERGSNGSIYGYVSGYHTGAGTGDATLQDIDSAAIGFLNDTYQQFDYNTDFPWGFEMGGATNYAGWEFVNLDSIYGPGSPGFFFNGTGLQWSEDDGFNGWLACEWWHGVPQLFWKVRGYNFSKPSTCLDVYLVPVDVNSTKGEHT